jgi:glutathione S-transferase
MRFLYHLPLSPFCRKVRLVLAERRLPVELRTEKTWEMRPEYLALNPAGTVPTLLEDSGLAIPESSVICEYIEEAYTDASLLGSTLAERVEARRLTAWLDGPFAEAVTNSLTREKYLKRVSGQGQPDAGALRRSYANMREHMGYIGWLAETRTFLAGDSLSLADLAAAAHISVLDFLGDIDWTQHPHIREWYARIKSRPSFRSLLNDRVPGMAPPEHYVNLDF